MWNKHNKQLPVSASQPAHDLHQRYLVHVGTAATAIATGAANATATATATATDDELHSQLRGRTRRYVPHLRHLHLRKDGTGGLL